MIKILYIWHDCFVVMTPAATIVFDYWLDAGGLKNDFPAFIDRIDPALPLVVVVSHSHKDHYNPSIFGWAKRFDNIHFVVSTDIWKRMRHIVSPTSVYTGPKVDAGRVTVLRRNESAEIAGVRVAAFPSTDVGNSYIVESAGRRIFHAGDLNCWAWRDDSTEQEIRKAEGDFRACLRDIAAYLSGRPIDYCFFPVDSRIGTGYASGAAEFVRSFDVRHFFPMHFELGDATERAGRRADAADTSLYANPERGEYIPLTQPGAVYTDSSGAAGLPE